MSKDLVLVLGYARSGTSALTRVISLCGCELPQAVFGATRLNPTGHWEPVDATRLNVEFITRHGITGDASLHLQEMAITEEEREDYIGRIQAILSATPREPVVIKEFRINELMEFWVEAARREGFSVKVVVAVRHPHEVFSSIKAAFCSLQRDSETTARKPSVEGFNADWLRTNLLAERYSRDLPRAFVEYSNLLQDWRAEIARISRALSMDMKVDEVAIDDFLTVKLHHQRYIGPGTEDFRRSWPYRVYEILAAAARNEPIDTASLDEIYHAYRATAKAFIPSTKVGERESSTNGLCDFVDRLPIWKSGRDF